MGNDVNLRRTVSNCLVERGFRRVGRTLLRRESDDWSFWVDTGPLGKQADIAPFAGIRNDKVEELFARLLGVPHDQHVGTVGANVGYLISGQQMTWREPASSDEVVGAIEEALRRFQPYMRLDVLPRAWDLKGATGPGKLYRLVVVAVLRRDREAALKGLSEARRVYCRAENEVCMQFRGFEESVMKLLDL
jgi:hypothetical protein